MVAVERESSAVRALPSADAIPSTLRRHGAAPRQVLAVGLIGTLLLAMLASRDLSSWLDRLGDGPALIPLQHAATAWDDAMARLGLTLPQQALRTTIHRLIDAQWPDGS